MVNKDLMYCGTSHRCIKLIDCRIRAVQASVQNTAKVNTLHISRLYPEVLFSGDSKGKIKLWDMRKLNEAVELHEYSIEDAGRPITHVTSAAYNLAVNSYDDVLRVFSLKQKERKLSMPNGRVQTPRTPSFQVLHTLQGHRNKNWPIKSSFYSEEGTDESGKGGAHRGLPISLLATGSAQNICHVYDLHKGTKKLLRGHQGKVYSCCFNPKGSPVLATASADSTVRVWQLKQGA